MKRFLNADSYGSTGTGLLGYNMFAYCENTPINAVDPNGQSINRNLNETDSGGGFVPPPVPHVLICSADEDGKGGLRALAAAEQNCIMYCGVTTSITVTKDVEYEVTFLDITVKALAESLLINAVCRSVKNKAAKWGAVKCVERGLTAASPVVKVLDKAGGAAGFFLEFFANSLWQSHLTPMGTYRTYKVTEAGYYRMTNYDGTPVWQYYEHTIFIWDNRIGEVSNYIVLNETMYYGEKRRR